MRRRLLAYALPASLALAGIAGTAAAEDLIQIYREALANDPVLSSARATWVATQEAVPQARAALLPSVNLAASANLQDVVQNVHTDPTSRFHQNYGQFGYTVSASQPLFRLQNAIALSQANQQVGQADYVLSWRSRT